MSKDPFPKEVLSYIEKYENEDPYKLLLMKSPFEEIDMETIVRQIQGRKIAKTKFPFLLAYDQYRYPAKISLEQSSSQVTAEYKKRLLSGKTFADLTGGMGIDSYLLGLAFDECTYVEPNHELFDNTMQNFAVLGHDCIGINTTCESFLEHNTKKYDWIYLDPSRRIEGNRKTSISNLQPNVLEIKDKLLAQSNQVMIKLSPMQDITECILALEHVEKIYVISVKNDVKELLVCLGQKKCGGPKLFAVDISSKIEKIEAQYTDKQLDVELSKIKSYIFQPSPVLIKSELQNFYCSGKNLSKIHPNTQLYTTDKKEDKLFGRLFEVVATISSNKKELRKILPESKANIITKNYPLSPQQLGKKLNIKEGGDRYVLAFTDTDNKKVICVCNRLY